MSVIINGINNGNLDFILPIVLILLVALVEITKLIGFPKKYTPIVAIVLGVIMSVLYLGDNSIKNGILIGLWLGLGSIGSYSTIKNIFFKHDDDDKKNINKNLNFYHMKK